MRGSTAAGCRFGPSKGLVVCEAEVPVGVQIVLLAEPRSTLLAMLRRRARARLVPGRDTLARPVNVLAFALVHAAPLRPAEQGHRTRCLALVSAHQFALPQDVSVHRFLEFGFGGAGL